LRVTTTGGQDYTIADMCACGGMDTAGYCLRCDSKQRTRWSMVTVLQYDCEPLPQCVIDEDLALARYGIEDWARVLDGEDKA